MIRSRTGKTRWGGGYSKVYFTHTYDDIISVENLLEAWREFVRGKRKKQDVQEFQHHLMDNILALHRDLREGTYTHGTYEHFTIADPKPRDIHKATVRDRLVHHALYRKLYPFFDRTFIADSYSCRNEKGTHKALNRFTSFAYKVSKNHTRTAWVLKCDVRKFFASIDQTILMQTVASRIADRDIIALIQNVVGSFCSCCSTHSSNSDIHLGLTAVRVKCITKGLPLGNLTSQLLVNIYMNEFDQYMKHVLKAKYYIRYADDFVVLSSTQSDCVEILSSIQSFLSETLHLNLHPDKVSITTLASGVDFLGWVHFTDHRVLRTTTKKRMFRRLAEADDEATKESYRGLLAHGNTYALQKHLKMKD